MINVSSRVIHKDTQGFIGLAGNAAVLNRLPFSAERSFHSPLRLLETLLSYGKAVDPRVIMQALNGYIVSNQQPDGIALFEGVLSEFSEAMTDETKAIYMACLGVLRATYANHVFLLKRINWVHESFALIEKALTLTGHEHPLPHWAAGMVYAQVPFFFRKRDAAYKHLNWLVERPDSEPTFGFYREVHHQLAKLHERDGNTSEAKAHLKRAGFEKYAPKSLLMGWFTNGDDGTSMAPEPVLTEVVAGRIFALFGFGFSDVYFVLSDDGKELIAIDAGTHPRSLKDAHDFLLAHHPGLPNITTAFITHAHWDHIGGHGYIRNLNPDLVIYGRENFAPVVERVNRYHSYSYFRGEDFDHTWTESYAPTHPIKAEKTVAVGGTSFNLIPVSGGETEDAMLIHLPDLKTVFVGDVVMPWYGEPWVNEGNVTEASDAIDAVISCDATHVLHGHHPLTQMFGADELVEFRDIQRWLVAFTKEKISNGFSAKEIVRLNPVPEDLLQHPNLYLAFLASRDTIILRTASTMTGIWREDSTGQSPEGLDLITSTEHGRMLEKYLGLTAKQCVKILRRMIANGDNELALQFAVAAEQRFGVTPSITAAKEEAVDRLRSAAQFADPFKFSTYSEMIRHPQKPMPASSLSTKIRGTK